MDISLLPEEQLILCAFKLKPNSEDRLKAAELLSQITDWKYFTTVLTDRGLAPLFLNCTLLPSQQSQIPQSVKWVLQQVVFKTLARNMVLYDAFTRIAQFFAKEGIAIIALKGIGLAESLYGDIQLRQMSDIDILVHPQEGARCIRILTENGYHAVETNVLSDFVASVSDFVHYAPMVQNGVSVEVHIQLHYKDDSVQINMDELWSNAESVSLGGVASLMPDLHHQLIHLTVHLHRHFLKGQVQFTSFADLVNILDLHRDDIQWEHLEALCQDYSCVEEVFTYLIMAAYYGNVDLPDRIQSQFIHLLTPDRMQQFVCYLRGEKRDEQAYSAVPDHIKNLGKLNTISDHLHYWQDLIFPSRLFIVRKYNLNDKLYSQGILSVFRSESFYFLWYPYRWFQGFKGLIEFARGKK